MRSLRHNSIIGEKIKKKHSARVSLGLQNVTKPTQQNPPLSLPPFILLSPIITDHNLGER